MNQASQSQQPSYPQPEQPSAQQPIYQQPGPQPVYQQPVYANNPVSPETQGAASTAMLLEIILGLLGLLGIGHVYSERKGLGIGLMVGWWVYMLIAGSISLGTLGFAACLTVPLYIAGPIISGIQVRSYIQSRGKTGSWKSVGMVIAGGVVGLIVLIAIFLLVISQMAQA